MATIILFALISLSCISAADNNASAEIIAQDNSINADGIVVQCKDMNAEETLTNGETEVSDFSTLNTEIANSTTDTIQLTKNYTYNSENDSNYTNGIIIDKADFTVDGQGHTIDGAGLARIFTITANNVALKNINFINGCSEFGGSIICKNGNLTIINCNFTNNKASEKGGALYVEDSFAKVVNTSFTQNNAPTGGAIYIDRCDLNIDNSTFAENNAFEGGAIYNKEFVSISITNTQFANNKAKYGGAIRNKGSDLTLTNDEFTDNHADYNGGAIYNSGNIDISNSKFANNNAEYGGAISHYDQEIIIKNTQFTNNTAERCGGAINNDNGELEISNTNFTQNTAIYGGAIENRYYLSIYRSILENNNAEYGGAIDNDRGDVNIGYSQFTNNTASHGGAIHNYNGNTITTSTDFTQNTANQNGGAISSASGKLKISDSQLTQNTANQNGGAVYGSDSDMAITYTKFTNNTAERYGGAINNIGTTIIMRAQFTNNTATHGGAINNDKSLAISSSILENNIATSSSGAIESDGMLIIENTQFTQNYAGDFAGAIGNWGILRISDSNFTQNSAMDSPGAIYNGNDEATITNTIFTKNTANTTGAIETTANMTISDSEFIGNGEYCIAVNYDAKLTLNNVTSDVQLVNDTINMIILEVEDVVYGNPVNIKVQVNSSAIILLNSGKVVVKVNGVEYIAEVKDGIATLAIPNLDPGTYNTNVTYIDNNMSRAEIPVNFTVKTNLIKLAGNKNIAMYYLDESTYKVRVTVDGKIVVGEYVTFIFNGKKFQVKTNQYGYAVLKITAKPQKALYSVSATYKGVTVKNKVKVVTAIIAKHLTTHKTGKNFKYKVTLRKVKNKYLVGKVVSIKVNGKVYKARTNRYGQATFVLNSKYFKANTRYICTINYYKDSAKRIINMLK